MDENSLRQPLLGGSDWNDSTTAGQFTSIPLTSTNSVLTQSQPKILQQPMQHQVSQGLFGDNSLSDANYPSGFVNPAYSQFMNVMNSQSNVISTNSNRPQNSMGFDIMLNQSVANSSNLNSNFINTSSTTSTGNMMGNLQNIIANNNIPNLQNNVNNQNTIFNMTSQIDYAFKIEEVDFKDSYCKRQSRAHKEKCQRVDDGKITFNIVFSRQFDKDSVNNILFYLLRTNESKLETQKRVGEILLEPKELNKKADVNKIYVHLDLDSLYDRFGSEYYKKIFELDRSNRELNKFHLSVVIQYMNRQISKTNTKCFQIFGKRKRSFVGRPYSLSASSNDSSHLTSDEGSPEAKKLLKDVYAHQLFANHIKSKTLTVDGRFEAEVVQSGNGDIAYHFKLNNADEAFEEGEVVVFVESEYDDRTLVIEKLNFKNVSEAALKGVVTRSQYFEAHVPKDDTPTEIIAVCGIVPVKVQGNVGPNEGLYASFDHPGLAVSEKNINVKDRSNASYIGYTVNGCSENTDENNINLVQTFVSIYQTASLMKINDRLSDMNNEMEERFFDIQKEQRKRKRICIGSSIVALIFLSLLGIFLWQYFVPGTAFRYYKCKLGRKEPHGWATFNFIPKKNIFWNPRVNGIEYEYHELLESMDKTNYNPITDFYNGTGFRFYKNIDRCAYAGIRDTVDITTGAKQVAGPELFAVDGKCFHAFFYSEGEHRWRRYVSVSWEKKKNIFCHPESKYKSKYVGDPASL